MLIATALAIATAVSDGTDCRRGTVGAGGYCWQLAEDICTPNSGQCGGFANGTVLPCCDADYRCVVMNEDNFFCRHRLATTPPSWDGRVETCVEGFADSVRDLLPGSP